MFWAFGGVHHLQPRFAARLGQARFTFRETPSGARRNGSSRRSAEELAMDYIENRTFDEINIGDQAP